MKKTNSLSIALLSKNPCEEKSLCKKLDEIDKMKNKILRESAAKMSNFAIQHLYIAKYYDAKNGEQCRPPLKVAQDSVCTLPRLTGERKQSANVFKKNASLPECFERRDCATSRPNYRRSLSDKSLPLSEVNVRGDEKESATTDDCKSQEKPNSARSNHESSQVSKPKCGRSLSDVAPSKSLDEHAQPGNTQRRFHAWRVEKENEETQIKVNLRDPAFKPKYYRNRSLSLCAGSSKLPLVQPQEGGSILGGEKMMREEGSNAAGKEGGISHTEAVKGRRQLQRRVTVAGDAPYINREFSRWQQTVKLVKDLPKSEQAEIFRGACFFRMALPNSRYVPAQKPEKPAERQRKISTVTAPCRQELSPSTLTARFSPLH